MTQEEKELLLKDLCARLPYRTKIDTGVEGIAILDGTLYELNRINLECSNDVFLPYLRPTSSMTEEEKEDYNSKFEGRDFSWEIYYGSTDWLNAHHFDYRGLIEKGLALEAHEDMYK